MGHFLGHPVKCKFYSIAPIITSLQFFSDFANAFTVLNIVLTGGGGGAKAGVSNECFSAEVKRRGGGRGGEGGGRVEGRGQQRYGLRTKALVRGLGTRFECRHSLFLPK